MNQFENNEIKLGVVLIVVKCDLEILVELFQLLIPSSWLGLVV